MVNFGLWLKKYDLKNISFFSSGNHVVQPTRTFWLKLVEGNTRSNSVKLYFEFEPVVQDM